MNQEKKESRQRYDQYKGRQNNFFQNIQNRNVALDDRIKRQNLLNKHVEKFNKCEIFLHQKIQNGTIIPQTYLLEKNKSITENFIMAYPDLQWNFEEIARTKKLSQKYILANSSLFFGRNLINTLMNPSITIDFLEREEKLTRIPEFYINQRANSAAWSNLSKNPSLTARDIEKYRDYVDWNQISANTCLDMNIILENLQYLNRDILYLNPSFDTSQIGSNLFPAQDCPYAIGNPNADFNRLVPYFHPTDFDHALENPNFPLEFFENKQLAFIYYQNFIPSNKNLTIEYIRKNSKELDFDLLSANPCVTMKMIAENDDLRWNIKIFSRNPSLTPYLIQQNLDKLDIQNLSANPSLTPQIVRNNPNLPWDYNAIQKNEMNCSK